MRHSKAHECYHCKQWVAEGEFHDCWTTTEKALTQDLSPELQDAYERVRETAADFGEQRIYASGSCIMFSRTSCYFFVRPKRSWLELAVFLNRPLKSPLVKRVEPKSKVKTANIIRVTHRDEVEAPLTEWLREAYEFEPLAKAAAKSVAPAAVKTTAKTKNRAAKKTPVKKTAAKKAAAKTIVRKAKKR